MARDLQRRCRKVDNISLNTWMDKSDASCATSCPGATTLSTESAVGRSRDKHGHKLKAAGAKGQLCAVWCTHCGSHARTVPRGLAKKCSGAATMAGARALHSVRKRLNPVDFKIFEQDFDICSLNEPAS